MRRSNQSNGPACSDGGDGKGQRVELCHLFRKERTSAYYHAHMKSLECHLPILASYSS